jgi:hypothetical protein
MVNAVDKRIDNWMRLQETTSLLREFRVTDSESSKALKTPSGKLYRVTDILAFCL